MTPSHVGQADLVTVSTAIGARQSGGPGSRAPGRPGAQPGRGHGGGGRLSALRGRVGHPREDDDDVDAGPHPGGGGPPSELPHRRGHQRDRDQRRVGHGGVVGDRGRRERRDLPGPRSRDRRGHQRGARPSRLLRRLRRAGGRLRPSSARGGPGAWWWGPTTPWPPGWAGPTEPIWWGRRPTPPTGSRIWPPAGTGVSFDLSLAGERLGTIAIPVTGANIARNAAVATVAALHIGAAFDDAVRAFARFAGVARRFEWRGEAGGVRFVDDYAHLPSEVRAVLEAARADRAGPTGGGVPAPPLQPDRGPGRAVRRRLLGRRRGGGDRHLRRRRAARDRG